MPQSWRSTRRYLVGPSRLELPTSCLSGTRSNLLSYEPIRFVCSTWSSALPTGGDDGIRTHDPLLAGQVLSQLSYTPIRVLFSFASRKGTGMRCRPRPTLPRRRQRSTLGTAELNFRVRNGYGWTLCVKVTDFPLDP